MSISYAKPPDVLLKPSPSPHNPPMNIPGPIGGYSNNPPRSRPSFAPIFQERMSISHTVFHEESQSYYENALNFQVGSSREIYRGPASPQRNSTQFYEGPWSDHDSNIGYNSRGTELSSGVFRALATPQFSEAVDHDMNTESWESDSGHDTDSDSESDTDSDEWEKLEEEA
ncbi:hypothetical protein B0H19DRAFT_1264380 [Mycena capillaripes]|nr:hypothetical protein B0H19DRAFT_1264380 [Mycena capillaripes]